MTSGWVSKIAHASWEDGPGLRTVVFLSGCNLRCQWCHNPESIPRNGQLMYYADKCIGCGECASVCSCHAIEGNRHLWDGRQCMRCGKCADACLGEALQLSARQMEPGQVFSQILRDKAYYRDNGGVTFSGGECLLQPEFLLAVLSECKRHGIHTCIETALHVDFSTVAPLLEWIDLVIADIKLIDPVRHKQYTGADNRQILENIRRIAALGKDLRLRVPLIPGVTDTDENLDGIADFVASLPASGAISVELLRYNSLADSKYRSIGREYHDFGQPQSTEEIQHMLRRLSVRQPAVSFFYAPLT